MAEQTKKFGPAPGQLQAVRERLTKAGVVVKGSTAEAFGKFMVDEYTRWDKVRETAGIPRRSPAARTCPAPRAAPRPR